MVNVKYFGNRSHAKRKIDSLSSRYPDAVFSIGQSDSGFCVNAEIKEGDSYSFNNLAASGVNLTVVAQPKEEPVTTEVIDKPDAKATKAAAKEAKAKARAEAAAEVKAAKAEARAARRAATPSTWKEQFAKAPDAIAAKVAAGKPPFRPGSKRDILHQLLLRGGTMEQAMEAVGWDRSTTASGFYELNHLMRRHVIRDSNGVYSYGDPI